MIGLTKFAIKVLLSILALLVFGLKGVRFVWRREGFDGV